MSASAPRIPFSVAGSLVLHAGLMGTYLYLSHVSRKDNLKVISNVDLMIQVRKPLAIPQPIEKAPTPPSTWNFLKMALPSVPKTLPQRLEVKTPEARRVSLVQAPQLKDRGRRDLGPKLEALDLGAKRAEMAKIDAAVSPERRVAALAALPPLEEVGSRRTPRLPQALALEERRQEAVAMQRLAALSAPVERRAAAVQPIEALKEAEGAAASRLRDKIASFLPAQGERLELASQGVRPMTGSFDRKLDVAIAPSLKSRQTQALAEEKKRGVEIEGPLADRRVASYEVPEFPSWAREQGMLEAEVAIRFWVSPAGEVLDNMRVERTSGYGRLDRLAMESLRKWKFVPLAVSERQWGVITFRFILE